jgi:hypothetical protein
MLLILSSAAGAGPGFFSVSCMMPARLVKAPVSTIVLSPTLPQYVPEASRSSFPPRARRTSLNFCLSWASAIRLELSERWAPQLLLRLFFIGPYHLAAGRTWAAGPPHVIDLLQLTRYLYLLPPCLRKVVSSGFAGVRALMHLIHGGPEKNV